METNIDEILKEKNKILSFSDAEFLSFLYSERDRYKDKWTKSGWTIWALVCSLFAIDCFIYEHLKSCNWNVDYHLCYYILCLFLPYILLFTYYFERNQALFKGDSRHVAMIKDIAPIRFLIFLGSIDILLIVAGLLLEEKELVIMNAISFVPIIISELILVCYKNRLVVTRDRFVISNNSIINIAFLLIVSGVILTPMSFARQHLKFGFSTEFEMCVAAIVGIVLIYIFARKNLSGEIESTINEAIDGYVYKGWSRDESLRMLEHAIFGKRPTYVLQQLIDKLKESEKKISSEREKFKDLKEELSNGDFSLEKYNQLSDNFIENCKIIQDFSKTYDYVLLRSQELVNIKHLVPDEGFLEKNEEFINSDTLRCSINSAIYFKNEMTIFLQEYQKKAGCEHL